MAARPQQVTGRRTWQAAVLAAICFAAPRTAACAVPADEVPATLIDRSVAVVGDRVITAREVTRQLRLQAFYEREPVTDSPAARVAALDRLIERRLIQNEMRLASFSSDKGRAAAELEQLRQSDFGGGLKFSEALLKYGLTERDVEQFVTELIDILRFIEFRFRTGMQITPEEVQEYYIRSYLPSMRRINEAPEPIEKLQGELEERIAQQRVDSMLERWLRELRAGTRVVFPQANAPPRQAGGPIIQAPPEPASVKP